MKKITQRLNFFRENKSYISIMIHHIESIKIFTYLALNDNKKPLILKKKVAHL